MEHEMSPKSTTVHGGDRYISLPPSLQHAFLLPSNQNYDADTIEELPITKPSKTYFHNGSNPLKQR